MPSNEKLKENFEKKFNALNKEQKLAVETIEGPVLVNAGPGTGKTQILSTRIGNILLKTDTEPHNILCLTFTDNGAVEMRKRLLQIIGSAAYNIQIHTFHSFCNEVIQDNVTYFGKLNLEPIGDLEEIELFYKLIDNIPNDSPLKRFGGEVYYDKNRLANLFKLMKKEAWTPEYIIERIENYIESLPTKEEFLYKINYKGFKKGDLKEGAYKEEKDRMELLKAAVTLYPTYNKMMRDISRYNFDDMILWVIDAFEKNKNLLLDYQERYLYILVDEFQDTSRSQSLVLQYLTNYWETPNLFVVGDADQSIYSFQDANVQNIESFREKYIKDIVQIDLVNNYRSTQTILNAAHALINNNQLRITNNDTALIASLPELQGINISPKILEFSNSSQEAIGIAMQIETLIQQGVSGKDIAVIYRKHVQADEIITILEQKKIAVNTKRSVNILDIPFIQNIIDILTWIDKEKYIPFSADDILFKILHSNFFNLQPLDIAKISMAVNEFNKKNKDEKTFIRSKINKTTNALTNLFNNQNNDFKEVSDILENLIEESSNCTLQQLFEKLIQTTGVLKYIMQSHEKPWLMQVLATFFNYIKEETKRNSELTLSDLLKNISLLKANKIALSLQKITSTENGVNFMTAHNSKGSEYKYVFVVGCTADAWEESKSNNNNFKLPDNLVSSHNVATDFEESRRLFYVAVTRAKTNLSVSYYLADKKGKSIVASCFVEELYESNEAEKQVVKLNDEDLVEYTLLQMQEKAQPEIALVEKEYLDRILQNYTLSVTHLNNYLSCPLKFYYQNLIKVPGAKSESMVFGSAVHYALEMLFKKMKDNNDTFPSSDEFVNDFKWYLKSNKEAFTPESFQLKIDYGEKILPAYYNHHINNWNKIVTIERSARNIIVEGIPLNGKFDKLEFTGTQVNVVDYKTGKYDNAKKKLNAPNNNDPNGGDYWRQAVFYKILIDNDKTTKWQALSTEFEFVEPFKNEYKTEKLTIKPEDITTVTQQIKDTWQKIQAKEFHTGCGKPECEWCNFVKTNKLAIALHQLEEEE
ncbi:MAG: ATP-dependent helicase [Chitinophagales bacterium]|nr:ATP-dependent helicase [Chitinophagales bacterium]